MSRKVALFAFNGETMCFVHVLLHALDLHSKGYDVKLIIEGSAVTQVKELADESEPFANLYRQVKDEGLLDCVCKACSAKMGSLEAAKEQKLPLGEDMKGHPSLSQYLEAGYEVFTF